MRTKASNQNKFVRFITIPIRALGQAREFYVRIITDYAQRVSYGSALGIQSGPIHNLPKSYSVSFSSRSSSADSDDLRELIRVASTRRLGVDMDMDMQRQQMLPSTAAGVVPRSCSVRMGRIDEEMPCFVAFHTLLVLYERYEDQVGGFVYSVLDKLQHQYQKLDVGVLSKIPKGKLDKGKKHE
ncbi:hypothetical protein ACSBR2_000426 [Camellia fascicularis]